MSDYNDGLVPEPCLRLSYGFGQQYASVELGDGTGYVRVTDDLRSEHHEMKRWYDNVLSETLDENAKLRELVQDMYGFIERMDEECGDVTFSDCFDYCKHDATDDGCCKTGECWYEQRMRELGVVE